MKRNFSIDKLVELLNKIYSKTLFKVYNMCVNGVGNYLVDETESYEELAEKWRMVLITNDINVREHIMYFLLDIM